ncbi:hypothetical protein Y032_0740g1965, partial [Ancylostoma ceylanicum]
MQLADDEQTMPKRGSRHSRKFKAMARAFSVLPRKVTSTRKATVTRNATFTHPTEGCLGASAPDFSDLQRLDLPRRARRFSSKLHRSGSHRPDFVNTWIRSSNFELCENIQEEQNETQHPQQQPSCRMMAREKCDSGDDNNGGSVRSAGKMGEISRQDSTLSFESIDDSNEMKNSAEETWKQSKEAKASLLTALTAFYSLFLTIFALVLELSHLLSGEEQREINMKDMIFGAYMYGVSILFFIYMYVVLLLNPRWYWTINIVERYVKRFKSSDSSISSAVATVRKVTHCGSSAGSLFLRLGCVVFGVTGVVYYAFLVFLCTADKTCPTVSTALDICAIVFIFTQMHFIFCNSKLSITGHHTAARFGTMHLIAANLWTWIRYVLMEEGVMEKEIREVFQTLNNRSEETMDEESVEAFEHRDIDLVGGCRAAECILGSLSEVMFTAIVEYSLIAAAVMYIVWRNIGRAGHGCEYVKRKHR